MKAQPVIVGVDGSPESLRAAAIGRRIADGRAWPCVLVYAIPEVWAPAGLAEALNGPEIIERLVSDLRGVLAKAGISDPLIVRTGKPGIVLSQVAKERGAGLIVLGGRHHAALSRALGGSTAHLLVRTADAPVLVIEPQTEHIGRVLAAVDLFAAGGPTLAAAGRFAELLGARLRAVHVVEPAKFPVVVPLSLDIDEFERRCRIEFQRLIEVAWPDLPRDERVVRRGRADEEIAEEASAWQADLVVVGSHGKGWIDRMLIGSTTERLLNRLPASLLVVPVSKPVSRRTAAKATPRRKGTVIV